MCRPEDMFESNAAVGSLAFAVHRLLSLRSSAVILSLSPLVVDDLSPGGIFSNDLSAITPPPSGFEKEEEEGLIRICSSISAVQMDDATMKRWTAAGRLF